MRLSVAAAAAAANTTVTITSKHFFFLAIAVFAIFVVVPSASVPYVAPTILLVAEAFASDKFVPTSGTENYVAARSRRRVERSRTKTTTTTTTTLVRPLIKASSLTAALARGRGNGRAFAFPTSAEGGGVGVGVGVDVGEDGKGGRCPYSMSFPRYRIDLTSGRSEPNRSTLQSLPLLGDFLSRVKSGADRSDTERRYASDVAEGGFRWVECRCRSGHADGGETRYENVRAAAAFWRAASDCGRFQKEDGGGDGVQKEKEGKRRLVLALVGADPLSIRRLVDVSDWLADRIEDGTVSSAKKGRGGGSYVVRATIDDGGGAAVPLVVFERRRFTEGRSSEDAAEGEESHFVSDEAVERRLKSWVRRILVDLSVCPFTKSDVRSGQGLSELGVPVGKIAYHHSRSSPSSISALMADVWEAILSMMEAGDSGRDGVSSILLAAPNFDNDFPLWAGPVFAILESTVTATKSEPLVGVVCFHPQYLSPDGSTFPGFGHMHSVPRLRKWLDERDPELSAELSEVDVAAGGAWQRRTPHATINVLRADQLEKAEGRRNTPELYSRNIGVLVGTGTRGGVGCPKLEEDLEKERRLP